MDYVRKRLRRGYVGSPDENKNAVEKTIVISPGMVEQANHAVSTPGSISLEELRFWAYVPNPNEYNNKNHEISENVEIDSMEGHERVVQDSYLDIVVFEAPIECSQGRTKPCNLSSYGVGTIIEDDEKGDFHLQLCNETSGRLILDGDVFYGYHTVLHIPPTGYLMKDRVNDPKANKIPSFPSLDSQYQIMIANCDTHVYGSGRNIELSGQVIFQNDDSLNAVVATTGMLKQPSLTAYYQEQSSKFSDTPSRYHIGTSQQESEYGRNLVIDVHSQLKLIGVGLFTCIFFTFATCRIHRGTRSDYFMSRLNVRRRQQVQEVTPAPDNNNESN